MKKERKSAAEGGGGGTGSGGRRDKRGKVAPTSEVPFLPRVERGEKKKNKPPFVREKEKGQKAIGYSNRNGKEVRESANRGQKHTARRRSCCLKRRGDNKLSKRGEGRITIGKKGKTGCHYK